MGRVRGEGAHGRGWVVAAVALSLVLPAGAQAATQDLGFRTSDGTELRATLRGAEPMAARPVLVEFTPYGRDTGTFTPSAAYNRLVVQIRGTGGSGGVFDALGPRTQADVVEVLGWACDQPWSDGRLALNGFSASAITVYNSLHQELPCVEAALLKSGTFELYRDLLTPGGITNLVPAIGVLGLIGVPATVQTPERVEREGPAGVVDPLGIPAAGLVGVQHPDLDSWWRERGFRGDVNDVPILMVNGWFDVESRGAFEGYQALRDDGAHLVVVGAHDGVPRGSDGGVADMQAWLDHHVLGVANGATDRPRARMLLSDGDREDYLAGDTVPYEAADWPVPGTSWVPLSLSPDRSGTALSLNDGSLRLAPPATTTTQVYPSVPSSPLNSDPPNAAIVGGFGVNALTSALPILSDMTLAGALGLSFTTPPLGQDVLSAGPMSLEVPLSSTAGPTGIWAVVSDVSPDGTPHPLTAGRLNTRYPHVDVGRSLVRDGMIVQPLGRFDAPNTPLALQERRYHVEIWPVGNRFKKGHRIRVDVVGASLASMPTLPALNTVRLGPGGARLLVPVLPGSDLRAALADPPPAAVSTPLVQPLLRAVSNLLVRR